MPRPVDQKRVRYAAIGLLATYWLAMFAGTHVPHIGQHGVDVSDKLLHFFGYAGLGFLLACTWPLARLRVELTHHRWKNALGATFRWLALNRIPAWQWMAMWLVMAAYAAIDEVSQIPVGRSGDVWDWVADIVGAAAGLALFGASKLAARQLIRSREPEIETIPLQRHAEKALSS